MSSLNTGDQRRRPAHRGDLLERYCDGWVFEEAAQSTSTLSVDELAALVAAPATHDPATTATPAMALPVPAE